jgi:hypothetical protein
MWVCVVFLGLFLTSLLVAQFAFADVWIPEDEYLGYFDSRGIYTVVGAVKNTEDHAITPTITVSVHDGKLITMEQKLPTVFPNKDIPFKIQIPHITNPGVVLEKPIVSFETDATKIPSKVEVMYDRTLKKHRDGHLTGKIINQGNVTEYNIKVYATIHGDKNIFLDTGKNIEKIAKIEPGQIIDFTMYPDPLLESEINYYSCFAIGDETIVPLYAMRNGEKFQFRYDSTAAFTVGGFDESGTKLYIDGINSFKVPTFVNFEFPMTAKNEQFDVWVNEKPVNSIQSVDEHGNWHVAFDIEGSSQNKILISGFANSDSGTIISDSQSDAGANYAAYFVIPTVIAAGIGVYAYARKKVKPAN